MAVDDSYTKALLHFDGVNHGTTYIDEAGNIWTNDVTYPCWLDTGDKKFGASSLEPQVPENGGSISTPVTSDLLFEDQDFTIDLWAYFNDSGSGAGSYYQIYQDGTHWMIFEYGWNSGSNYFLRFRYYDGSLILDVHSIAAALPMDNAWHHVAAVRDGIGLKLYFDGSQVASGYPPDCPAFTGNVGIGGAGAHAGSLYTKVDEVRVSKGIARWTGNFTPPSEPYGPPGLTVIAAPFEAVGSIEAMGPVFITAPAFEGAGSMEAEQGSYPPVAIAAAPFAGTGSMQAVTSMVGLSIVAAPFEAVGELSVDRARGDNRISATLPALTMAATLESRSGRIRAFLPMLRLSLTGLSGSIGSISARLPVLRMQSTGLSGTLGQIRATLPKLIFSASGNTVTRGTIAITLPALRALLHGRQAYPVYKGIAMNPKILAVTEYEQYPFNSFATFQGFNLGATATGIHKLTGPDDNGAPIDAEVILGKIPLELNKVRDVWVEGRASGDMRVSISADEGMDSFFEEDYLLTVLGQDRVTIPRGLKPVYIQIGIFNEKGSDFDIDAIQIIGEAIERKKR